MKNRKILAISLIAAAFATAGVASAQNTTPSAPGRVTTGPDKQSDMTPNNSNEGATNGKVPKKKGSKTRKTTDGMSGSANSVNQTSEGSSSPGGVSKP